MPKSVLDDRKKSLEEFLLKSSEKNFGELKDDFHKLASTINIADIIEAILKAHVDEPHIHINNLSLNEILLHESPSFTLALKRFTAENAYTNINTLPSNALFACVSNSPLEVIIIDLPTSEALRNNEGLDLKSFRRVTFERNKILDLQANRQTFKVVGDRPTFVLCLFSKDLFDIGYSFNGNNGKIITPIANNLDYSRTAYNLGILRELGIFKGEDKISNLATNHPAHYVRWEAVKTLGHFKSSKLRIIVESLTNDPHPHIRRAAATTLANMEEFDASY